MTISGAHDEKQPTIWIVGGPNGAGKTTLYRTAMANFLTGVPYLNADDEARKYAEANDLQIDEPAAVFNGGREVINRIRDHVEAKESFIVETTFSGGYYPKLVDKLEKEGWKVNVIAVGLSSEELSNERIAHRVKEGGHHIDEELVAQRWPDVQQKIADFCHRANKFFLVDNSEEGPVLVAKGVSGAITEYRPDHNLPQIFGKMQPLGMYTVDTQQVEHVDHCAHFSAQP